MEIWKCGNASGIALKGLLLFLITATLCQSCKSNNGYSGDHLPPKVMQQVLLDINLAESYSSLQKDSLHKNGEKNLDSLAVHYKDIFAHYNITKEQFTESLIWYKSNAGNLDTLYSNILPVVAKWQAGMPQKPKSPIPPPVQPFGQGAPPRQ